MDKTKHHYVPRFYLKRFAIDREEPNPRQIRLYNITSGKYVPHSGLYDQCHRSKFYGQTDTVEDGLAVAEGHFAQALRAVDDAGSISGVPSEDYVQLLVFAGMQLKRTTRAAEEMNEQVDKMMKSILAEQFDRSGMDDMKEGLDQVKIGYDNPVFLTLRQAGKAAVCFGDLKAHLFTAGPDLEFITSDHPVQLYNMYCEGVDWIGVTGLVSTGLMVFMPVSPRHCTLLYDGSVYKVDKPNVDETIVNESADLNAINGLQYVGADQNLYFAGDIGGAYFRRLVKRYSRARNNTGIVVKTFEDTDDPDRTLFMHYPRMPNLRFNISFISIRRKARKVSMHERAQSYRMDVIPPNPFDPEETWEDALREADEIRSAKRGGRTTHNIRPTSER